MDYIHKLPFMLGALMAIVIGLVSYRYNVGQQDTYIRMAICMIVFYILGIYIRNTITRIFDEVTKKKEEIENKERKEREEAEAKMQEELMLQNQNANSNTSKFDFKIDEQYDVNNSFGEDFSPLTVREIIRTGNDN